VTTGPEREERPDTEPATSREKDRRREKDQGKDGALKRGVAFAEGSEATEQLRSGDPNPVRDAGPQDMRDEDGKDWDAVDEGSDESFPASDPPSHSRPRRP